VSRVRLHVANLPAQLRDPRVDPAPVELDLGLARSARADALTAGDPATGLPGHRLTPTAQARQEILQLGQLDLRLALPRLRVLGEDVEDQRGAVDDLDLDDVLQGAPLGGRQLGVADDGVGALGDDDVAQFLGLARAQPGAGVRALAALDQTGEHRGAGRLGECGQFAQGVLGVLRTPLGPHAGQDDAFEPQLAVLDLGDVLEFGRQPLDALEGRAFLAVELLAVAVARVVCRVRQRPRPPGQDPADRPHGFRARGVSVHEVGVIRVGLHGVTMSRVQGNGVEVLGVEVRGVTGGVGALGAGDVVWLLTHAAISLSCAGAGGTSNICRRPRPGGAQPRRLGRDQALSGSAATASWCVLSSDGASGGVMVRRASRAEVRSALASWSSGICWLSRSASTRAR
jgi:hypothetical protein